VQAIDYSATVSVGTFVIGGMLAALAWFFRQWAGGVEAKVDQLGTEIGSRLDRIDSRTDAVEAKADDARLQVAWLAGAVGKRPPTPESGFVGHGLPTGGG